MYKEKVRDYPMDIQILINEIFTTIKNKVEVKEGTMEEVLNKIYSEMQKQNTEIQKQNTSVVNTINKKMTENTKVLKDILEELKHWP